MVAVVAAAASPAAGATPAADDPALQPPFAGQQPPPLERPESRHLPPPGFELSATEAVRAASAEATIRDELAESPGARPQAGLRGDRWQVDYVDGGQRVAFAVVDGRSGEVDEAWRDHQVEVELARGYEGAVAQKVNAPYVWLPLCLLFVLPFLDRRRPLRLLHLDLLAIVGLSVSLYLFNRAQITASVPLTYPVLGYVLARMLVAGFRPRARGGPLVPHIPVRWLAIGAVILACARIALNVADSRVIDVGVAGVVGADHVTAGEELYEGDFSPGLDLRGDVYGPANYLAYLPFELAFPWEDEWGEVPAAHAAAIAFDLLTAVGLVALGRRLRPGRGGRELGVALAFAWLACPWTLYAMNANANDALVAASVVGALVALASPAGRGALLAVGAAAKLGTAALGPLFATGDGERRWRQAVLFTLGFAAVAVAATVTFVPDGGFDELYDRTLGYQATRGSPFSVWGLAPSLDFAQPIARIAAVGLAVAVAFVPRRKSAVQVAALAAAVIVAVQLTATHWFYFYVVWFLPAFLAVAFAEHSRFDADARGPSRSTSP